MSQTFFTLNKQGFNFGFYTNYCLFQQIPVSFIFIFFLAELSFYYSSVL